MWLIYRPILHKYANEDVSLGSWFIGLEVEHIDDRNMCCGTPPGIFLWCNPIRWCHENICNKSKTKMRKEEETSPVTLTKFGACSVLKVIYRGL